MALALSVEYPTVGAQYVAAPHATEDATYSTDNEYLGYYDAESCYRYNNVPTETPTAPLTTTDYKRFDRIGAALPLATPDTSKPFKTSRKCTDAFSGNFLNWSSNSAIDMLRLALTGGDRVVDTASLTILQRAVIPTGDPTCMWNSSNFPAKHLTKDGGGTGSYWGAVPNAMVSSASGQDIWVANRLNRIYFRAGSGAAGGCGDQSGYTLGSPPATAGDHGPAQVKSGTSLPSGTTFCANENGACSNFTGVQELWYGAGTNWSVARVNSGVGCTNGNFGDPISGTAKKCYWRAVTSESTVWPAPATGTLNSDGYFFARVQVCSSNALGALQEVRDYPFCTRYPNGNFKPTGAVQKYSDQLRLAAFGYLMDQTASYNAGGRYGGVLRAPMKYVGPKTFDVRGVESASGNANAEWDASTGIFNVNPDGNTVYNRSGVITYLNQFGRTGPQPGRYKIYDPVGELHYQALRYLQGLPPSADAVSDITSVMEDGFPVYTNWTDIDPYKDRSTTADYSCTKSNIVVIGDINTHDGNRTPSPDPVNNIVDIPYWRGIANAFERNQTSTSYVDGQGATRNAGNPNGANYSMPTGSQGSQIIGSAYWAHTHDIRGVGWTAAPGPDKQRRGLRVKTFVFDVNEYGAASDAATRRTSNQFFMAAKYGGFESDSANPGHRPYNTQGNPFKRNDGTVDRYVWEDNDPSPSRTGEAQTYYLQSDARGVLSAFDAIFSRASTQARSIAGGALTNKNLAAGGSSIFQAAFDTADWSGDVISQSLTLAGGVVTPGATPNWTAATRLGLLTNLVTTRKIYMGRAGASTLPKATSFTWDLPAGAIGGGIDTTVRQALDKPSPSSAADGKGEDRLNYLRGDRTKERNPFRARNKLLGDIINSGIVYSGAPTTGISDSTYPAFYTARATRTAAVYVGANDGMLHAFNAGTGDELFAYIPSWLAPRLSSLTDSDYVNNHQSFVDGQIAVAEAKVGSAGTSADWATMLVGTTGNGGQGVFALDVTDPSTFGPGFVKWEFTDADDPELGNVVGRPQILKFRTSAPADAPTFKYFAVVASGVNNQVADGNASLTGNPALFLLDLAKAPNSAWVQGSNYYKIVLPIDATLALTKAPGLINFSAAGGPGGQVAQIYMGDLHGNLWKLDFSLYGTTDWNMAKLSTFNKGTMSLPLPYPLYAARDASGNVQPITMAPAIAYGPTPESSYVMFGTGKYLESSDRAAGTTNSVYTVFDNGSPAADGGGAGGTAAIRSRARLKQGTVDAATGVVTVGAFAWGRATSDTDATQRSGWYFDFPIAGERQVSNVKILPRSTIAIFGSLIPGSVSNTGACSTDPGGGNEYTVEFASGNGTSIASNAGILGEPLVIETAMVNTTSDSTGRRVRITTNQVIQQGSLGLSMGTQAQSKVRNGRLSSWRQINNYVELKNGAAP